QKVVEEGNPNNEDVKFIQVDSYDNPHISENEINAMFFNLDPEKRLARTRGMFTALGDKIYGRIERNLKSMAGMDFPADWPRIEAMDSGVRHPTAWLFAVVDPKENIIYVRDEYRESN